MKGPNNVQMKAQAAIEAWTKHADDYMSDLKNYVEQPTSDEIIKRLTIEKLGEQQQDGRELTTELRHADA